MEVRPQPSEKPFLTPHTYSGPQLAPFLTRTACGLVAVLFVMSVCLVFIGTCSLVREHKQIMSLLFIIVSLVPRHGPWPLIGVQEIFIDKNKEQRNML